MVTISTTTSGATIRYTTDGTDPGPSSTQYTAPIAITAAVTIKAIATASGFADSAVGSAAYTILAPAATPTFGPGPGAVLSGTMVTISTTTSGATIRYTTDGTDPGPSSTQYTAPITITAAVTIKAIATAPGFTDSAVASAAYTILAPAATPTFSPAAGAVLSGTTVTISTTTAGATIRYTTDGTDPGPSSTQYTAPIAITAAVTIKAMATAPGFADSAVGSATYTILAPAATPTFSPLAGAVAAGTAVTISTTTANAMIFYTTDGTQPATSAGGSTQLYSAPVSITTATTINAIAVAPNFANSAVGSAAYTIVVLTAAATPTFSPAAGVVSSGTTVTISSATAGATIYYTTDGTQPGTSAGGSTSVYSTPIAITAATTINAVAVASGFLNSAVASGVYTLTPAATPVFAPDAGIVAAGSTVAISSTTPGAAIYYTTDGTSPQTSASRTLYAAPIAITAATTINAVATATGFADSTVATAAYTLLPFVATPTFNPPAGGVTLGTTVTISSTTAGAVIHYTTDGTTPGTSSAVYSTPIAITAATTINAIATASGFSDSAVATASYTLSPLVVQSFNTATNASLPPGTINFNAVGGIVNPTDLAAAGTGHTKALAVVNTNFNSVPTVQVTLPNALSMYTKLQFDYYAANSDAAFKSVYLFASNTAFPSSSPFSTTVGNNNLIAAITTGNPIGNKGAWATVTVDLTATPPAGTTNSQSLIAAIAAGTTYFGLGESGPNGSAYFIDNIRVVDAADTSTTLQDFEGTAPTLGVINYNAKSGIVDTTAFASMAANSVNPNNTNELMVLSTNYNSVPTFGSVTLPNGTVLSNYKSVKITYYALNAAAAFKPAYLYASTYSVPQQHAVEHDAWFGGPGRANNERQSNCRGRDLRDRHVRSHQPRRGERICHRRADRSDHLPRLRREWRRVLRYHATLLRGRCNPDPLTESPVDILGQVQQAVWRRNAEQPRAGYHEYIAVSPDPQGIAVDFWGEAHQESFAELLQALRTPEVAAELRSLTIRGPDEGANGTRNWDLGLLVGKGVQFPSSRRSRSSRPRRPITTAPSWEASTRRRVCWPGCWRPRPPCAAWSHRRRRTPTSSPSASVQSNIWASMPATRTRTSW